MENSKHEYLCSAKLIKNETLAKSSDWNSPDAAEFCVREGADRARAGVFKNAQQGRGHSLLPALRQRWARLLFLPVGLLHNVGGGRLGQEEPGSFHFLRARWRKASSRPFLRISATGNSIFGPFAAAIRSCSWRCCRD